MTETAFVSRLLRRQQATSPREIARAAVGGGLGIGLTGGLSALLAGAPGGSPLLIAPIGASTVLLFAVPASPLAQPYAILGGNLLAALTGVTAAWLVPSTLFAAPLAVAVAIAAMALCRCIHPPSGAVALVAVLGGPHVLAAGYTFVAVPVLLNSLLLIAVAIGWNRLTGQSYPHVAPSKATPSPARALALSDYEAVLAEHGDKLTIEAADLRTLHETLADRVRVFDRTP